MDKQHLKKDGEELQQYLLFRRRGQRVALKKGKGSVYKRSCEKDKAREKINNIEDVV